jgi:HPt (histidine-containing phosphotransfer) domain-containing protein
METHLTSRFTNVVNASFTMKALLGGWKSRGFALPKRHFFESKMPQPAIDLVHLARQTGGDHELERELLALFSQQCVRHLRTIHAAQDARSRIDAAHTLKGAARAIGAWEVADAADAIERHLAQDDVRRAETAMDALALAAAEARAAISRFECAA